MRILTINCGSSTLKFELFDAADGERSVARGIVDRIGGRGSAELISESGERELRSIAVADHGEATLQVIRLLDSSGFFGTLEAVGHRVVHGGVRFSGPVLLDARAEEAIEELAELAPLHNGPALAAIHASREALGSEMRQVAAFDTAFHSRMPRVARLFALPRYLADEGVLRYGFHGLSYEYVMGKLRALDPEAAAGRVLIAHLGNGASMVAVRGGVGVDTTMGFTPTGGLVMGTRSGDLDPSVPLFLLEERGMSPTEVSDLLNKQAGLLGVSETSADMRDLLEREASDPRAAEAVALFCYQAKKFLGALTAALGGLDVLVFTGGIGEHSSTVRERICEGLGFLGIRLDPDRNAEHAPVISRDPVTVRVIPTDENLMVARHTRQLLTPTPKEGA